MAPTITKIYGGVI